MSVTTALVCIRSYCKIVPVYKKGLMSLTTDNGWTSEDPEDDGRARVHEGMSSWTLDGHTSLPQIETLTEYERDTAMTFASFTASMYVVGHNDYVRSVRILPTGPETCELTVDWLLPAGVKAGHEEAIERILELGTLVVEQDGGICELNQQGLRSPRHESGVLVPQEYALWAFSRVVAHTSGCSCLGLN